MKSIRTLSLVLVVTVGFTIAAFSQDAPKPKTTPAPDSRPPRAGADAKPTPQAELASKTAKFEKVAKADDAYKKALDAHALADAQKQIDKEGAFKGMVAKVFEPRSGAMVILNFDENYQSALTAMTRKENFDKFPALTNLIGKEVLITGKFAQFQNRVEMVLTNPAQIKLVE